MFDVQAARQLQLPTFMAGGVWHTVIVIQPFIWDAAHPVLSVIYCYCTSVLGRLAGELAACLCWQSTAWINCPGQSGATKYDVMVVKSNSLSVAPTLQAVLSKQTISQKENIFFADPSAVLMFYCHRGNGLSVYCESPRSVEEALGQQND